MSGASSGSRSDYDEGTGACCCSEKLENDVPKNGMALDNMPKMPKKKRYLHQKQLITNEPLRRLIPSKIPRCKYVGIHASRFGVWWGLFVILIIIIIVIIITVSLFYRYDYVQSIVVGTSYKS